eukprot:6190433-Pleurochrysis_carterae.AAC.1
MHPPGQGIYFCYSISANDGRFHKQISREAKARGRDLLAISSMYDEPWKRSASRTSFFPEWCLPVRGLSNRRGLAALATAHPPPSPSAQPVTHCSPLRPPTRALRGELHSGRGCCPIDLQRNLGCCGCALVSAHKEPLLYSPAMCFRWLPCAPPMQDLDDAPSLQNKACNSPSTKRSVRHILGQRKLSTSGMRLNLFDSSTMELDGKRSTPPCSPFGAYGLELWRISGKLSPTIRSCSTSQSSRTGEKFQETGLPPDAAEVLAQFIDGCSDQVEFWSRWEKLQARFPSVDLLTLQAAFLRRKGHVGKATKDVQKETGIRGCVSEAHGNLHSTALSGRESTPDRSNSARTT